MHEGYSLNFIIQIRSNSIFISLSLSLNNQDKIREREAYLIIQRPIAILKQLPTSLAVKKEKMTFQI
jgi:hypothetical protein